MGGMKNLSIYLAMAKELKYTYDLPLFNVVKGHSNYRINV